MTETNQISVANDDLHSSALTTALKGIELRPHKVDLKAALIARRLQRERLDRALAELMARVTNDDPLGPDQGS